MTSAICSSFSRFTPAFSSEEQALCQRLEEALTKRMLPQKPRRLAHCKSVAHTASYLAHVYGADEKQAYVAGLLHDWDKVLSAEEELSKAAAYGISLDVPKQDVLKTVPLLHGMTAAAELRERFPELPPAVIQAIDRHTIAHPQMSDLDMVVFVADGIEPLRAGAPSIERTRSLVGESSLFELFFSSFSSGLAYVIETNRFVYPKSIELYNSFIEKL